MTIGKARLFVRVLLLGVSIGWCGRAAAIDIQCIEASRYKYLYKMFDNDRSRFAQFLQVSEKSLPDGELCRAALLTGAIESAEKSKQLGQPTDADKLLDEIA